jgi:hypothetical protein
MLNGQWPLSQTESLTYRLRGTKPGFFSPWPTMSMVRRGRDWIENISDGIQFDQFQVIKSESSWPVYGSEEQHILHTQVTKLPVLGCFRN